METGKIRHYQLKPGITVLEHSGWKTVKTNPVPAPEAPGMLLIKFEEGGCAIAAPGYTWVRRIKP